MKRIGIWMDKEKAKIVVLTDGKESLQTINSFVETFRPFGGSGTKFKGGPQDVVQDSKYLERERHQLRHYFQSIIKLVSDVDELAIFGPAETLGKFKKELDKNYRLLAAKVKTVQKSDSMTDNQVKALVSHFFG